MALSHRIYSIAFLIAATIRSSTIGIGRYLFEAAVRAIDYVIAWIAPRRDVLALAGFPPIAIDDPGEPLERSLQHGLRHEAGYRRRSAARHI